MNDLQTGALDPIIRLTSLLIIMASFLLWPEDYTTQSIAASALITLTMLCICNSNYIILFTIVFLSSTVTAYLNYLLLAPYGLFETSWQEPLATDSQFFLYEARRFISDYDVSALFSTWGSLVPVAYGSMTLIAFQNHFIGIVFFNCVLFTICIRHLNYLYDRNKGEELTCIPACLMPLQLLYNAMLSKEILYLFLVIELFYFYKLINRANKENFLNILCIILLLSLLLLFRPTGALIFILIIFFNIFIFNYKNKLASLFLLFIALSVVILLIEILDYRLPLLFLTATGELNLGRDLDLKPILATTKGIPAAISHLFSPPWSLPFAPVLGFLWLISPIPYFGAFFDAAGGTQGGQFTFMDFATIIRYFDSIVIFLLLFLLAKSRSLFVESSNPVTWFLLLHTLSIASLDFFESGRHRYLPGVILMILYIHTSSNYKPPSKLK